MRAVFHPQTGSSSTASRSMHSKSKCVGTDRKPARLRLNDVVHAAAGRKPLDLSFTYVELRFKILNLFFKDACLRRISTAQICRGHDHS